jgi:hypothetical protein
MKRIAGLVLLVMFACSFLHVQRAVAVYGWIDQNGVYHMSDVPNPTGGKSDKEEGEELASPEEEQEAQAPPPVEHRAEPAKKASSAPVPTPAPSRVAAPKPAPAPAVQPAVQVPVAPKAALPVAQQTTTAAATATTSTIATTAATVTSAVTSSILSTALTSSMPAPVSALSPTLRVLPRIGDVSVGNSLISRMRAGELPILFVLVPILLIVCAVMYIYYSLCMYLIAKKLDVPAAWTAWIPIANLWPFVASAGKSLWWALLLLVPIVNLFVMIYLWMCIAENLGRNKWLGLLMLIPLVNLVYLGVLAFSEKKESE